MMLFYSISVLFLLSLLDQSISVQGQSANQSGIRVEIDPDVATIASNCTLDFQIALNSMLMPWLQAGLANNLGYKPPFPMNQSFTNYVWQGELTNRRMTEDSNDMPQLRTAIATPPSSAVGKKRVRDLQCSWSDCSNCCLPFCLSSCWIGYGGGCGSTCGPARRRLRRSDEEQNWRELTNNWPWWGQNATAKSVSYFMQSQLRAWLGENDPDLCLGNPWTITCTMKFF